MIARRVVEHLAANTDLRASMLVGSAAVGTSDEHSDIDLINYYDELPAPAAFAGLMRGLGADPAGDIESLDLVANAPPSDAAEELRKLVGETKARVRAEMPDVDVDRPWRPDA